MKWVLVFIFIKKKKKKIVLSFAPPPPPKVQILVPSLPLSLLYLERRFVLKDNG